MGDQAFKRTAVENLRLVNMDTASTGLSSSLLADYLQALFLQAIREGEEEEGDGGEGKFGRVPLGIDPNSLLSQAKPASGQGERPRAHPLLSRSSQFSGVDKKLTATPHENASAREIYPELRLQNQNRLQHGKRSAPVLKR